MSNHGYHIEVIPKGELGELSKIQKNSPNSATPFRHSSTGISLASPSTT